MNNIQACDFPKVSVLITVYNLSKYLEDTLNSVISQDYKNLEVIVVDDCSQDTSPYIIKRYMEMYPGRVVGIFNEVNLGISKNSNVALAHSTGDLIAILDGDDLYLPGKISAQVALFMTDTNISLSYHSGEIFDSSTGKILYITDQNPKNDIHTAADIILKGGISITSSVMMRRDMMPSCGFNEKLPSVNDWWLFIEVSLSGKVVKLPGTYARYRKHERGVSQKSLQLLEESLSTLDLITDAHPDYPNLQNICNKGKARYIAGEAYRQMPVDSNISVNLYRRAMKLDRRLTYAIAWFLLKNFPLLSKLGNLLNTKKYLIKKMLSL